MYMPDDRKRLSQYPFIMIIAIAAISVAGCEKFPWELIKAKSKASVSRGSLQDEPPVSQVALEVAPSERVATVNQHAISLDDMSMAIRELKQLTQAYGQSWKPLGVADSPDALDLHDVMKNLIDAEIKAQDARARGLDRKTEVRRRLAYLERSFYAQEWDKAQRDQAMPKEEEIHKFYEDYKAGFVDPERIHVRQIVIGSLSEAESARSRAISGAAFSQLAAELSVGAGKENGGDVGWFMRQADKDRLTRMGIPATEQTFFPQLESVAFALEPSQISQPVKGLDGRYYIVQLDERKAAKQKGELDVREGIKEALIIQQVQQNLDQLRQKIKIEEYPERLGSVEQ